MSAFEIDGELVGTFDGAAGDQLQMGLGKVDLLITDTWIDDQTGEPVIEVTTRAHQPVDEQRIRTELPRHAVEHLIETLEGRLEVYGE